MMKHDPIFTVAGLNHLSLSPNAEIKKRCLFGVRLNLLFDYFSLYFLQKVSVIAHRSGVKNSFTFIWMWDGTAP